MGKSLRESVGGDLAAGSLTWQRNGDEAAIDRLVASAWTGECLGRRLARLKYGGDTSTSTYRTALWEIVARMERKTQYGKERYTPALRAMCEAALEEWLNDRCPNCTAGWQRPEDAVPVRCRSCNGVARLAWTDEKRLIKTAGQYDVRVYDKILRKLQEADQRHNNQTRKGLIDVDQSA